MDLKAGISFGREWFMSDRASLSNDYQAFLDYFAIQCSSDIDIHPDDRVTMHDAFEEVMRIIDVSLPKILSALSHTDLEKIEVMPPLGIQFLYKQRQANWLNLTIAPPKLI